jgi:phosphoribosylanthranilate isomerase
LIVKYIEMVRVKICGITNLEDAMLAAKFGADELGFNFFEMSPRYVDPQKALQIVKKLSDDAILVGVFVNMEEYRIGEFVDLLGLSAVQLHGDEDVDFINELKRCTDAKVIKAFRVGPYFLPNDTADYDVDAVLLDAYRSDRFGGTGEIFDWSSATAVNERVSELYLAGGLTPENVTEAVQAVRPYAVDVASGVESVPGKKDPKKLEMFIKNAKNA